MSGKTICFFSLFAAITILVSGCSGVYVPKPEVDETLAQQQEYIKALEHRNRELEADAEFFSAQREFYDQIARNVEKWLTAQGGDLSGVKYNPRTGSWTMEGDLLFASGSYTITPEGKKVLKTIAGAYADKPVRMRIVGHTDRDPIKKRPTKDRLITKTNLELSTQRAIAVDLELRKHGISKDRMFVEGRGNNDPVAPNDNVAANKKKNRRVEIFILGGKPAK
ncbi:MAG: OmpA/MotB family protein [Planctomycetota bacterium]|jgi:flagellar motor protein MotB